MQIILEMASIQNTKPASIVSGSISASIDPYSAGTQQVDYQAVTAGTHNITAGKYRVRVHNTGLVSITVNADTVQPGERWEAQAYANPNTQKLDLTPAVEIIVPANGSANYMYEAPSA